MAIEKYYFNQASYTENNKDVLNWLKTNANEYFDSFERIDTVNYPRILCKIETKTLLDFATNNPYSSAGYKTIQTLTINTDCGTTVSQNGIPYVDDDFIMVKYAIKTSGGIMLYMNEIYAIFITKSNAESTSIYVKWRESTPNKRCCYYAADLINSKTISTKNSEQRVESSGLTALAPFCFPSGTYAPNMFLTPFSQFAGTPGIIEIDGTKYVYDGYVALKE